MSDPKASHETVRLRQLVDAVVEGSAAPDELRELDAMLQASAEHRRYYRRTMGVHAELNWLHRTDGAAVHTETATEVRAAAATDTTLAEQQMFGGSELLSSVGGLILPIWRLATRVGVARVAAALMILGTVAALGGLRLYHSIVESEYLPAASITVAELKHDQNCEWVGLESAISVGSRLASGSRLELAKGTAKLLFDRGATLVVESPTVFELLTPTSIHLVHGTVAVRVEGTEKEFTVASPDASIVDLGTSFGVHRGEKGATEVEVFEGAVEVYPAGKAKNSRVLGIGASAQVQPGKQRPRVDMVALEVDRFGDLLEFLWDDLAKDTEDDVAGEESPVIVADFADGPVPGAVDTFYGAARGRGWRTPWVAAGNPIGEIVDQDCLAGKGNPYLRLRFGQSVERCIARQYGSRAGFDPSKPHVISWRWRFDGDLRNFGDSYHDRIHFYGNSFFRRNSWPTNTWLIGVVGGDQAQAPSRFSKLSERKVFPRRWYAFDSQGGDFGTEFDKRNMVDSGMELKMGVVYQFAVVVYPAEKKYDVAIRDDQQTFKRTGLSFRDRSGEVAQVVHFGAASDSSADDFQFSLDSIRIEPLKEGRLQRELLSGNGNIEPRRQGGDLIRVSSENDSSASLSSAASEVESDDWPAPKAQQD